MADVDTVEASGFDENGVPYAKVYRMALSQRMRKLFQRAGLASLSELDMGPVRTVKRVRFSPIVEIWYFSQSD